MAERIINESDPRRTLTLGQYPAEIQREYGYDQWIRVEPSDARQILSKPMNGTPQETGRLIDKLSKGDLTNVHPSVREILPYYLLNDITSGDAVKLLTGVQPGAAIGLKAAEKFMEGQNKILGPNDVSRLQTILPHLGAAQAYRFDERYIMDIFRAMGTNAKLTMPAAVVLQHKFENFTANISRTYINNPMLYLSGYDIETIPVSVLCAFSPMEISQLSSAHKIVLLERLGWVEDIEFRCPRNIRMVIVTEGFNAMDLVDMRRVKPCWGSSQRRAVAQLIKDALYLDNIARVPCIWIQIVSMQ
ncbi:hypothetical protein Avbf_04071 [Armadillidium vulgare]|nr:hypothetical protein Avbf_04071 [Armadillidium vulgare]